MNPGEITFVILARNEEARIERALASVPPGCAALVLDAESNDGTVEAVRRAAPEAQVIVRPWEGFVAARRFALARVTTPWCFMLDADETLDDVLRAALLDANPTDATDGFIVRRTTYLCGRPVTGAGWGDEPLLRLFRTARARLEARPAAGGAADLHERWIVDGQTAELHGRLLHDSYPTLASYWEKFGRYTSTEARALGETSVFDMLRVVVRACARAPWLFVARGAWRDGWRGAFVALASAAYPVAVTWKAGRGAGVLDGDRLK